MWYGLDENKNVVPITLGEFIDYISNVKDRRVAFDVIDGNEVSTVFLSLDHAHRQSDKPIVFETMIFDKDDRRELYSERYSTWNEALEGHKRAIEWVKGEF